MYEVRITPTALKQLARVPKAARSRIDAHLLTLAENPRPQGVKKLEGSDDLYRIRVGDCRVLYYVRDAVLLVLVVKVGQRGGFYK